jgi:hypothetical protein
MSSSVSYMPARNLTAVTPSDSTLLNFRALYIGGTGNVAIMPIDGTTAVTLTAVPVGTVLYICGSKVMATNTTATLIVAFS